MIDLFHSWDDDGSGDVTLAEFQRALLAMGMTPAPYQVAELFESFDRDNSGYIDYRELAHHLKPNLKPPFFQKSRAQRTLLRPELGESAARTRT